jgi:diketogulonate reductase-like aldo/keto reductase
MASKLWIVPIPGTRQSKRIDENLGSLAVTFSNRDIISINNSLSKTAVSGRQLSGRIGEEGWKIDDD